MRMKIVNIVKNINQQERAIKINYYEEASQKPS